MPDRLVGSAPTLNAALPLYRIPLCAYVECCSAPMLNAALHLRRIMLRCRAESHAECLLYGYLTKYLRYHTTGCIGLDLMNQISRGAGNSTLFPKAALFYPQGDLIL